MSSIVMIVPFKDLADRSKEACLKSGTQIPIYNVKMDKVVEVAKEVESSGAEVIISRGMAALKIMESAVRIPVVSIPINGFDLLRAYVNAKKLGERIGIVDTPKMISSVESLEAILDIKIEKIPVHSLNEIEQAVNILIEKGIDVLIGKFTYVQSAKRMGVKSVMLKSGVDSILQAIREAENIVRVRRKEIKRTKQMQAILDFITDGVISVDNKGIVTVCNPAIEKMLNIPYGNMIGRNIDDLLSNSRISTILETEKEEINRIQEINGMKMIANHIPIHHENQVLGVVSTFQEINKLQQKEQEIRKKLADHGHITKYKMDQIVGESEKFLQAISKAKKYAKVDSTILLTGATGVGKEVFAHIIHSESSRSKGPFVAVNCAAIPAALLESELFGYVEGAFSGAKKGGKMGLFEMAHRGTIFLDEIGEMEELLQARILRVLQEAEVRRLGDDRVIPINIRVIAATNRDLEAQIAKEKFRSDLYYRINILNITIPSLQERKEDIPILCQHFLKELSSNVGKELIGFEPEAIKLFQTYDWPGNIRELRNIVERSMILSPEKTISYSTVLEAGGSPFEKLTQKNEWDVKEMIADTNNQGLLENEKAYINRVLKQVNGNKTEAAKILGIGRSTLWRKLTHNKEGGPK
ncbi:sigma 54-interacting transcriptional regulator [Metabacillus arenae]|uniref:Sigma 54-interacting transcriptional regulator n=1 Tax=Metabacillus arenae TaxID=2771434 RepID=A0A926NB15_9BACI|nr:sigma 54-interacting transcriptional regulator [Metabacillus arenae]MBD1380917.1 sigma 54-interacting transcriptional regulator [Metabacillus arenae]